MSHAALADLIGISKRSVQTALAHLIGRHLLRRRKSRPTAVPVYTVLTPWNRKANTPC
jgi:DNA-binding GntR family transcriptional regulator